MEIDRDAFVFKLLSQAEKIVNKMKETKTVSDYHKKFLAGLKSTLQTKTLTPEEQEFFDTLFAKTGQN